MSWRQKPFVGGGVAERMVRSRPWVPMMRLSICLVNVKEEHADRVGGAAAWAVSRKTRL
jgi:hypothetical protein